MSSCFVSSKLTLVLYKPVFWVNPGGMGFCAVNAGVAIAISDPEFVTTITLSNQSGAWDFILNTSL